MKNRERQRANRRLRYREELLDKKNSMGAKDLTAYNAVKQIVTNGNALLHGDNHQITGGILLPKRKE